MPVLYRGSAVPKGLRLNGDIQIHKLQVGFSTRVVLRKFKFWRNLDYVTDKRHRICTGLKNTALLSYKGSTRWCRWLRRFMAEGRLRFPMGSLDFSLTYSFQPHYGPGVESASKRNEYQEYLIGGGVKAASAQGLQPCQLNVPTKESWEPQQPRWNPRGLSRPVQEQFYLLLAQKFKKWYQVVAA